MHFVVGTYLILNLTHFVTKFLQFYTIIKFRSNIIILQCLKSVTKLTDAHLAE